MILVAAAGTSRKKKLLYTCYAAAVLSDFYGPTFSIIWLNWADLNRYREIRSVTQFANTWPKCVCCSLHCSQPLQPHLTYVNIKQHYGFVKCTQFRFEINISLWNSNCIIIKIQIKKGFPPNKTARFHQFSPKLTCFWWNSLNPLLVHSSLRGCVVGYTWTSVHITILSLSIYWCSHTIMSWQQIAVFVAI